MNDLSAACQDRVVATEGRAAVCLVGAKCCAAICGLAIESSNRCTIIAKGIVDMVAESCSGTIGGTSILSSRVLQLVAHWTSVTDILRTTDTTAGDGVLLLGDIWRVRDVRRSGSASQLEDGRSPAMALHGNGFVFGCLGRDTTWQVNVGEDGVLLCHSHVNLLALNSSLSFVLALHELLLGSVDVSLVDVGSLV